MSVDHWFPTVRTNPTSLLFSYGSNHPAQLAERLGHPVVTGGAYLPGHIRIFRGDSKRWAGGVASLAARAGGVAFGLVTPVTAEDLARMDGFEGAGYKRIRVRVTLVDGRQKDAWAYVSRSEEFHEPSRIYLEAVAKTVNAHWHGAGGKKVTWRDIDVP